MADSQRAIDWDAVRRAALDCLNATWSMICSAAWSQGRDYDVECAASHLAVIDGTHDTFRRAMEVLQPGLECAADDSDRHSPVFDAIAKSSVGEGPRPDFRFGPVCCATAHEAAFELLRRAILWVENGLNDELDEAGLPDECVAGIDDLHKLSPEELRDTLARLERRKSLQTLLTARSAHQVRAWIDREWAAVRVAGPERRTEGPQHSDDFRSVWWDGTEYVFTPTQAACVAILWRHWEQQTSAIGEPTLIEAVDSTADRLRDIFDKGKHPAWGAMIVSAGKGVFRLQEREKSSVPQQNPQ